MSASEPLIEQFDNGLTVLIEPMADVQSAAFSLLVPAGSVYDPADQAGCASVLADMITRGAGDLDSAGIMSALDSLGLQRSEGAERQHLAFNGATLAENLLPALEIYADVLQCPHLPEEEFEPSVAGAVQSLLAMDDEPRQKVMLELRRRAYPAPWGQPSEGSLAGLELLSCDTVHTHFERFVRPNGAILGIAGNVDPKVLIQQLRELFAGWASKDVPEIELGERGPFRDHIPHESTQTQIGIAFDSIPYRHPDYYQAWAAVSVLSGGSSSRLFTEVREKRGLCYSVYASLTSTRDIARVLCYAGTSSDRAQETLDVTLGELDRIKLGIELEEVRRCQARAKSSLIMQQESSSSRSGSLAHDYYHLGRVVSLPEIRQRIEALTPDSILGYLAQNPPRDYTILTLGPQPLEIPHAVS